MKSVVTTSPKYDYKKYPCLYINAEKDLVVLFTRESTGTVVHSNGSIWDIGHHSDDWKSSNFTILDGSVTLSND